MEINIIIFLCVVLVYVLVLQLINGSLNNDLKQEKYKTTMHNQKIDDMQKSLNDYKHLLRIEQNRTNWLTDKIKELENK